MLKNAKNMEPTHDSQYRLCKGNNKKGLAIKDTTFEYVIYANIMPLLGCMIKFTNIIYLLL